MDRLSIASIQRHFGLEASMQQKQIAELISALRDVARTGGSLEALGNTRNRFGMALAAAGRYRWALRCYERAETELTQAGDREGAALARNNRGTVLYELGDYDAALDLQIEAISRLRTLGAEPVRIATGLRNIGAALHKLGRFAAACVHYAEAIELLAPADGAHRRALGPLFLNRGAAKERLGDIAGAAADYAEALSYAADAAPEQIAARSADASYHLATVLERQGETARARILARSAVVDAARAARPDLVWRCLAAYAQIGLSGDARIALGKIAATLLWAEARRAAGEGRAARGRYLGVRSSGFTALASTLIDTGRLAEALAIGATVDRLGVAEFLPTRWLLPEAVALTAVERQALSQWSDLSAALREAPEADHAAQALAAWLDAPISAAPHAFSRTALESAPVAPGRYRLQFVAANGRLRRVAFGAKGVVEIADGPPIVDVYRRVFDFAFACRQDDDIDSLKRLGRALHDDLLAGLGIADADDEILEVVADGPLRALPWAALWDGTHYLVERHAIELACGGAAAQSAPRRPLWALFAASGNERGAVPLPHAAREVAAIAALGGCLVRPPAIDSAFTRDTLRAAVADGASALHIAGHFALDPADLGRSLLRLGDGTALDVRALAALDLSGIGEFVLSSCEAGLGDRSDAGGDAKSLPDLLAAIGVEHIVAALWPVPDASTADLMIGYHRARLAGHSPAHALARVQRAAIADGRSQSAGAVERGIGDPAPAVAGAAPKAWAGFCAFRAVAAGPSFAE